jgi:hypothetical protein
MRDSINDHCSSVTSLGYGFLSMPPDYQIEASHTRS